MSVKLHLTRDSGFTDFARRYDILINGEIAGGVRNGGVFECDIPSGRTLLQVRVDWCGSNTVEFEAPEGGVVHLECGSNLRGWKILQAQKLMRESPNEWIWLKHVDHPKNPKEARHSERAFGRFGSYFEYTLLSDRPLTVNYRLWLQEGLMQPKEVAALSNDSASIRSSCAMPGSMRGRPRKRALRSIGRRRTIASFHAAQKRMDRSLPSSASNA
jgi:hypothetical protein